MRRRRWAIGTPPWHPPSRRRPGAPDVRSARAGESSGPLTSGADLARRGRATVARDRRANVKNLMLKEEVVEAVRAGRFHVWAIDHIDEGLELLMERTAGERAADGTFPEVTVHRLVQDRLRAYAEQLRAFGNVSPGAALPVHAWRSGHEDVPR